MNKTQKIREIMNKQLIRTTMIKQINVEARKNNQ